MKTIERLKQYIDYKDISLNSIDKTIGTGTSYIGKQIKRNGSIGSDILEKIVSAYPDLNPIWLITGNGEMIADIPPVSGQKGAEKATLMHKTPPVEGPNVRKSVRNVSGMDEKSPNYNFGMPHVITVDSGGNENIVHVPIRARAGYLLGYGDQEYIDTLETFRIPGLRGGTYRSFEVEGQSMKPVILNKDWVIGQWVEDLSQIRENRVHIVVTKNDGILIKRVINRIQERGKLYLKSDTTTNRHDHPTLELDVADIAEVWYARVKFSFDFSEPSDIYTRLNELEIGMLEMHKIVTQKL